MRQIPHDGRLESTLALVRDGYRFSMKRAQRLRSPLFSTRVGLRRAIVLTGAEGARLFYDRTRVQREGASPFLVKALLFGQGTVQGLDGEEHRHRKAMHMDLMTPEEIERLAQITHAEWERFAGRWTERDGIQLFEEVNELIFRAMCAWTGVACEESEVDERVRAMVDMVEGLGKPDLRHLRSQRGRRRGQQWAERLVREVRERERPGEGPPGALRAFAWHRDLDGRLLPEPVAGAELLNMVRPGVAVARWVVYLAVALHTHEGARERIRSGEWQYDWFVEETRRLYPFFPMIIGQTRGPFDWRGYRFPGGRRLLLDVHATHRDPTRWEEAHRFRPERFRGREVTPYEFIPQGGGDYWQDHRCAGEWATLAMMRVALHFLAERLAYDVPPQDLRVLYSRMPGTPESGFVMSNVRWR